MTAGNVTVTATHATGTRSIQITVAAASRVRCGNRLGVTTAYFFSPNQRSGAIRRAMPAMGVQEFEGGGSHGRPFVRGKSDDLRSCPVPMSTESSRLFYMLLTARALTLA